MTSTSRQIVKMHGKCWNILTRHSINLISTSFHAPKVICIKCIYIFAVCYMPLTTLFWCTYILVLLTAVSMEGEEEQEEEEGDFVIMEDSSDSEDEEEEDESLVEVRYQ